MIRHTRDNETNIIEIETMDIEKGKKREVEIYIYKGIWDIGHGTWDMDREYRRERRRKGKKKRNSCACKRRTTRIVLEDA